MVQDNDGKTKASLKGMLL